MGKFGTLLVLLTAGLAYAQSASSNQYGVGLGKLLTTERERVKIDHLRFNKAPEPSKKAVKEVVKEVVKKETPIMVEAPKPWRIDGISNRPNRPLGQRISVWIEGQVYPEDALPQGLSVVRNAAGEVIGLNSVVGKGTTEFAKIGDSITRPQTAEEAKAIEKSAVNPLGN